MEGARKHGSTGRAWCRKHVVSNKGSAAARPTSSQTPFRFPPSLPPLTKTDAVKPLGHLCPSVQLCQDAHETQPDHAVQQCRHGRGPAVERHVKVLGIVNLARVVGVALIFVKRVQQGKVVDGGDEQRTGEECDRGQNEAGAKAHGVGG